MFQNLGGGGRCQPVNPEVTVRSHRRTEDEALKTALEVEAHQLARRRRMGVDKVLMQREGPSSFQTHDVEKIKESEFVRKSELEEMLEKYVGKRPQSPRAERHSNVICFACDKVGHFARKCPSGNAKAEKSGDSAHDTTHLVCTYCHRGGHQESECRTKIAQQRALRRCNYCNRSGHEESKCWQKQRCSVESVSQ